MNQNTMYKTSFVTGVPPVFYDIFIPGQYYCWASCVTNLNVGNLGNTRLINNYIVPDAYQVEITLTEMVLPSKNQFNARFSGGGAAGKVKTSTVVQALEEGIRKVTQGETPLPMAGATLGRAINSIAPESGKFKLDATNLNR